MQYLSDDLFIAHHCLGRKSETSSTIGALPVARLVTSRQNCKGSSSASIRKADGKSDNVAEVSETK
jgi:hypothetical protein